MLKRFLVLLLTLCFLVTGGKALAETDTAALLTEGESCLEASPPDYEKAALLFKRAGLRGEAEGYYRLAEMYETGKLNVGNPCTDDLDALGLETAREYYALAAQAGYAPAKKKLTDAYRKITQDEAKELMAKADACIILDVRTAEEYASGHIPGAICVPVESITEPPEQLPDYDRTILVYCRSGRRSKQAAQKLAELGYTDIREFGGINDWTGDIVTEEETSK